MTRCSYYCTYSKFKVKDDKIRKSVLNLLTTFSGLLYKNGIGIVFLAINYALTRKNMVNAQKNSLFLLFDEVDYQENILLKGTA